MFSGSIGMAASPTRCVGLPSAEVVNQVAAFTNTGTDRTLDGDRIVDPTVLAGDRYETFSNRPLFGPLGPTFEDINQGALGDCWILAGLGSIADRNPDVLEVERRGLRRRDLRRSPGRQFLPRGQ